MFSCDLSIFWKMALGKYFFLTIWPNSLSLSDGVNVHFEVGVLQLATLQKELPQVKSSGYFQNNYFQKLSLTGYISMNKSSRLEAVYKESVIDNFTKFPGKSCRLECFPLNFIEIFKSSFFKNNFQHLRSTVSSWSYSCK